MSESIGMIFVLAAYQIIAIDSNVSIGYRRYAKITADHKERITALKLRRPISSSHIAFTKTGQCMPWQKITGCLLVRFPGPGHRQLTAVLAKRCCLHITCKYSYSAYPRLWITGRSI